MSDRLYRIQDLHGGERGPATVHEVCLWISEGVVTLDAFVADDLVGDFVPITQFPLFAKAFEARLGVTGIARGSDSTPSSSNRPRRAPVSGLTPPSSQDEQDGVPKTAVSLPPVLDDDGEPTLQRGGPLAPVPPVIDELETVLEGGPPPVPTLVGEVDTPIDLTAVRQGDMTPVSSDSMPGLDKTIVTHDPPVHEGEPSTPVTQSSVGTLSAGAAPRAVVRPARPRGLSVPAREVRRGESPRDPASEPRTPMEMPGVPALAPEQVRLGLGHEQSATSAEVFDAGERKRLYAAVGAWVVLFVVLFSAGIVADLGQGEARYFAGSSYFYVRVLLLLSMGAGLSALFLSDQRLSARSFALNPSWGALAVVFGILAGVLLPSQDVRSPLPIALSMSFLHGVSEETFFRGFIDRALARALRGEVLPTVIGAAMYGLYHLTYASMWLGHPPLETWLWSLGVIVMVGVPFSLLYHMSKSFAVPLACHLAVNFAMIISSGRGP